LTPSVWQPASGLPRSVNALLADPAQPGVVYAGTGENGSGSGVYRSLDYGLTWQSLAANLPSDDVMALAYAPGLAGTDHPLPSLYAALGPGRLYASQDGGVTWQALSSSGLFGGFEQRLYVSPADPRTFFHLGFPGGLARTTDAGETWQSISNGLPVDGQGQSYIITLAFNPTAPDTLYAGTGGWVGQGHGVYKSTDGGLSWSAANTGMLDYRITALAVDPSNAQVVLAGTDDGQLFISTDAAVTWSNIAANLGLSPYQSGQVQSLVFDLARPQTIYLLTQSQGLLVSMDLGAHWTTLPKPRSDTGFDFSALAVLPGSTPVYVVSSGSVWCYTPGQSPAAPTRPPVLNTPTPTVAIGSANWQAVSGLPRAINDFVLDPAQPGVIYAGAGDTGSGSGVYQSLDYGQTWLDVSTGLPSNDIEALALSPGAPSTLLALIDTGQLYASLDGGASWSLRGPTTLTSGFERRLYVAPADPSLVFALSLPGGLVRSSDAGQTWQTVHGGLPTSEGGEAYVLSLAFDPANVAIIYAGTGGWTGQGHGVYRSADGGLTWQPANTGMLDYRITALAIDPADSNTLYAGSDDGYLFKSTDSAVTWMDISAGLPFSGYAGGALHSIIFSAAANSCPPACTLYVLNQNQGLAYSPASGASWHWIEKPANIYASFTAAVILPGAQPIFIGALDGNGAWRIEIPVP
jgi:photosystem II stability/assembly factor-like uncharacterized protein